MGFLIRVLPVVFWVGCYDLEYDSAGNNQPPTILIVSPENGSVIASPVHLEASATDPEDGDLSPDIVWVEVDMPGGRVGPVHDIELSPGVYRFEARVSDTSGAVTSKRVLFTVEGT